MNEPIPPGAEIVTVILEPPADAAADLAGWQQCMKADLEEEGMVVTEIAGATFTGYRISAADRSDTSS